MLRRILFALLFTILCTAWSGMGQARTRTISFDVETGVVDLDMDKTESTLVRMDGFETGGVSGQPALPWRTIRLAIPPQADSQTVTVQVIATGTEEIIGRFDVAPAPPIARINDGKLSWGRFASRIVDGHDTGVYGVNALFPGDWGKAVMGVKQLGRHDFVEVKIHPVRYNPVAGTLIKAVGLRVEVSYQRQASAGSRDRSVCRSEGLAGRILDNIEEARGWYTDECLPPPSSPGLAVITTDVVEQDSEYLDDYVQMRIDQGYSVTVATEAEWDYSTGSVADNREDRIRKWLVENESVLDLGWVLLIGNPDPSGNVLYSIPMKFCASYDDNPAPTDFYYSDLTDNWDSNGNGTFCENVDSMLAFIPTVYVGRIPVYSDGAIAVDEMLVRIIDYEAESESGDVSWRRRVMLPNSIYFFDMQYGDQYSRRWDGASVGEYFIRDVLTPRGMEWTTLYEHEGLEPSIFSSHFQIDTPDVVDQWVRGYGITFWTGHGSHSGVYRLIWNTDNDNEYPDYNEMSSPEFMATGYSHMLETAPPTFVIHGSCSNGYPESADNLGYNLLRRGAIGTVSASRAALTWHFPDPETEIWEKPDYWDGDVIDIVTEYSNNLLDGMEAGRALGEALAATSNSQGVVSFYQKCIQNLYGDPLIRLVMCRIDADCDNELFCDGEEICDDGSCVSAGEPVECAPTEECDEMACDEDEDACMPSGSCIPDGGIPDSGTDTDTGPGTVAPVGGKILGARSGCSLAGQGESTEYLLGVILKAIY